MKSVLVRRTGKGPSAPGRLTCPSRFLVPCHHAKHVMHAAAHVPLKKSAPTLRINIEILLITLDNQFILAVPVKVGELVALPGPCTIAHTVGGIFGFDEVMINGGTHM